MENRGFRYSFTFKEILYFSSKKSPCPKCGMNMQKSKAFTIVNSDKIFDVEGIYASDIKVKDYFYLYTCPSCGSKYTLSELVNKKGGK